jgi:hypothetical protein
MRRSLHREVSGHHMIHPLYRGHLIMHPLCRGHLIMTHPLCRGHLIMTHPSPWVEDTWSWQPTAQGCHDQVSSTQGVVMIRCPLHRGFSWSSVLYTGGGVCHDEMSFTPGGACSGVLYTGVYYDQVSSRQWVVMIRCLRRGVVMNTNLNQNNWIIIQHSNKKTKL